jgi:hypothetical protein
MAFTKDKSIFIAKRVVEVQVKDGASTTTLLGQTVKLNRSRTGVSQPGYRKLIRQQLNATTDLSGTFESYKTFPGTWHLVFQDVNFPPGTRNDHLVRTTWFGDIAGVSFSTNWWTPTLTANVATNRASIAFLKHCRAVQREFSAPTFLGELKETIGMMRRPAAGLRQIAKGFLDDCKHSKKASPKNWKRNLSSAWLEHTFGWMPLASDVAGAYKAYQNLVEIHDNEQREVHGIGIEEIYVPAQSSYGSSVNTPPGNHATTACNRAVVASEKAFVKYHGMVKRQVDTTLHGKLARVGFEPSEFLPTAWELLPWSFLVDYFSNIGDVIEGSMFDRALLSWASADVVRSQKFDAHFTPDLSRMRSLYGAYFRYFTGDPVAFVAEKRVVNRYRVASIPSPELSFELPGSPAQFTNMLALWTQANDIHPQRYRGPLSKRTVWGIFHQ